MSRKNGISVPWASRVPSLAANKIAHSGPLDAVLTTWSVGVGRLSNTICPPRIVESVVCTRGGWSSTALLEKRAGGDAGSSNKAGEESAEANHDEEVKMIADLDRLRTGTDLHLYTFDGRS